MTTGEKIKRLMAIDSASVSECEAVFIESVISQSAGGEDAAFLTRRQVEFINRLYIKHFGD